MDRADRVPEDTIFALASGQGAAGIAVFRVSGPGAGAALAALGGGQPVPRVATRAALKAPDGVALDDALVLWFPAPHSFTGEDVVELHVHGGRAVGDAVAAALGALPGLRPALAGEFSRRAFGNGKLDLTQAEALADLVAAETEAQRLQALDQLGGGLSRRFEGWRKQLVALLAEVEAAVDFADEEIPADILLQVLHNIHGIFSDLTQYIDDRNLGERLRGGFHIAIVGAPNVGKSSLLNALARRDVAIVSESAGTTRDVIEVHLDLGGLPVILADTAGLHDSDDSIEVEGIRRAEDRARMADLRLAVFDATQGAVRDAATARYLDADLAVGTLSVLNKVDCLSPAASASLKNVSESKKMGEALWISAKSGEGLDNLLARIEDALRRRLASLGPSPMTRERHRHALREAAEALSRALDMPNPAESPEILAEELRLAARALGRVAGRVDVEDVLDRLFSQFCIGK